MAIQHRRGAFTNFDPSRLLPGEWAVVLNGDDGPSDGKAVYICFAAGDVKRISTYNDMAEYMDQMTEEVIEEITAEVEAATQAATAAATQATAAKEAADAAAGSADDAAEAAGDATEAAYAAIEAMGDISELAVPEMSEFIRGGAKLGDGLTVEDDALNLGPLVKHSTGQTDGSAIYGLHGEGWSEQETTTGKNLFDIATMYNSNAVTRSGNSLANAVTDTKAYFALVIQVLNGSTWVANALSEQNVSAGQRSYSFTIPSGITFTKLRVKHSGSTRDIIYTDIPMDSSAAGQTFTLSFNALGINVQTVGGAVLSDIMLETGSTATSYEPYTGGKASPNPDYPQEIKVARGRNLISDFASSTGAGTGSTATKNGDSWSITTDNSEGGAFVAHKLEAGKAYTIHGVTSKTIGNIRTFTDYTAGTLVDVIAASVSGSFSYVFTATADCYLRFWVSNNTVLTNLQLELGTQATPYVPYGHVGLEVQGRNLATYLAAVFNMGSAGAGILSINGSGTCFLAEVQPNTTYTVSKSGGNRFILAPFESYPTNSAAFTAIVDNSNLRNYTFTTGANVHWVVLYAANSANASVTCQIELGSTATPYEPYHHTTTPVPLPSKGFLGALPDGTKDTLAIDSAGGVVVGNGCAMFDMGDATWQEYDSTSVRDRFVTAFIDGLAPTGRPLMCEVARWTGNYSLPNLCMITATSGKGLTVTAEVNAFADAAAFKSAVSGKHMLYPLATPTTESLGYIDLPALPEGATVTCPELENVGVDYWVKGIPEVTEYGQAMQARLQGEIDEAEQAIADLAAAQESLVWFRVDSTTSSGAITLIDDRIKTTSLCIASHQYSGLVGYIVTVQTGNAGKIVFYIRNHDGTVPADGTRFVLYALVKL